MGNMKITSFVLILVLFLMSDCNVLGKVHVVIRNELEGGRVMNIRCRSKDDDIGHLAIPDGHQIEWKFSVNLWGSTLFSCDVQWDDSKWHGFVAYSYRRDSERCENKCLWLISRDGLLYGFNEQTKSWDVLPFEDGWS
ncbi:hypothetical protein K2173_024221 [Erythroxylum novogranatense]|uniref:S-protein homolog n=1 Tax=Erythroxylum novogranatense TaxID=1862640 RepID=A0AAV8UC87_9ROSI|nr:hypothetical protein K2173_024221 [Erythroxylum novogranatense]